MTLIHRLIPDVKTGLGLTLGLTSQQRAALHI